MVHIENSVVHIGDQIFHQQSGNIQGNLRDPRMEPNLKCVHVEIVGISFTYVS